MLVVFFNDKGVIHKEFVLKLQTSTLPTYNTWKFFVDFKKWSCALERDRRYVIVIL